MKRIYVAGPYTKPEPIENTRRAIAAGERLVALGFTPFIPHLTMLWNLVLSHPPEFWYDYDNQWLAACDAVLRLPGESVGADNEVALAESLGIPVFHSLNDLVAARNSAAAEAF